MNLHIHIHKHNVDEKEILKQLKKLTMANERIEAALATLSAKQSEAATSIDGIAADITYLKDGLPATGGMTEAEVEELTTKLEDAAAKATAAAEALKSLDDSTNSAGGSEPPVEPPVEGEGSQA